MESSNPDATVKTCRWCSSVHAGEHCPLVKAVNFDHYGAITRIEFLTPADYGPGATVEPEPDYPRKGQS